MAKRTRERVEIEAPGELRDAVRARGISDELLERALAAGVAIDSLWGWLGWRRMDAADLTALIGWHERFTTGDLRAREATEADGAAFCDLWENSPEEIGDLEITVLRGPDAFAQFRLQRDVHLHVLADGNVLVASCGWARRNVQIAGPARVGALRPGAACAPGLPAAGARRRRPPVLARHEHGAPLDGAVRHHALG